MATGTIKRINSDKGFGFIRPDEKDAKTDIFFHATDVKQPGFKELEENMRVSFSVIQGERGPRAQEVTRL